MGTVLFLLLVLSLCVNLAQLLNAQTAAKQKREADSRVVLKCMDIGTTAYRESMTQYRSGKDPKLFHRALGAIEVVAAIREAFPR